MWKRVSLQQHESYKKFIDHRLPNDSHQQEAEVQDFCCCRPLLVSMAYETEGNLHSAGLRWVGSGWIPCHHFVGFLANNNAFGMSPLSHMIISSYSLSTSFLQTGFQNFLVLLCNVSLPHIVTGLFFFVFLQSFLELYCMFSQLAGNFHRNGKIWNTTRTCL